MPRKIQKIEWDITHCFFKNNPRSIKCKRSKQGKSIKHWYLGKQTKINHSFLKFKEKTYAMAKARDYIGYGRDGKVKQISDKEGNTLVVKVLKPIHPLTNNQKHDQEIMKLAQRQQSEIKILDDLGYLKEWGSRYNDQGHKKTYVVMDNLGVSLDKYLKNHCSISRQQKIKILQQCIEEVANLHTGVSSFSKRKYIHRDIRPQNFTIDKNGQAHLIDYGVSIEASSKCPDGTIQRKEIIGTQGYVAPEIRKYGLYSFKSDIFACAKMLRFIFPKDEEICKLARRMVIERPNLPEVYEELGLLYLKEQQQNNNACSVDCVIL